LIQLCGFAIAEKTFASDRAGNFSDGKKQARLKALVRQHLDDQLIISGQEFPAG
jgi:hypothetical protein